MLRDPIVKDGDYATQVFIMESAKEAQEWDRFLPASSELPPTHEHFIENFQDQTRGGIICKRVGVRLKPNQPPEAADGLDKMSLKDLELEAAKTTLDVPKWKQLLSKPEKVSAIREARNKQPVQSA